MTPEEMERWPTPEGYRKLKCGEPLREGDMWVMSRHYMNKGVFRFLEYIDLPILKRVAPNTTGCSPWYRKLTPGEKALSHLPL